MKEIEYKVLEYKVLGVDDLELLVMKIPKEKLDK